MIHEAAIRSRAFAPSGHPRSRNRTGALPLAHCEAPFAPLPTLRSVQPVPRKVACSACPPMLAARQGSFATDP